MEEHNFLGCFAQFLAPKILVGVVAPLQGNTLFLTVVFHGFPGDPEWVSIYLSQFPHDMKLRNMTAWLQTCLYLKYLVH